jgi:hypothetical protein
VPRLTPLLLGVALFAHQGEIHPGPILSSGRAGEIVSKAIEAAGGWRRWSEMRDVSFASSTAYFHPLAGEVRESVGVYKMLPHSGERVRFESVDLSEHVAVVVAGEEMWIEREGVLVCDPPRLDFARLHLLGNLFWFSLPFSLAETWVGVTDEGDRSEGGRTWHRLRVQLEADSPPETGNSFVVYIDAVTGLIDRVLGHVNARLLAHPLLVGFWRDYREVDGLRIAHHREVFPADPDGSAIGPVLLDQVVQAVRLDGGLPAELFRRPIPQPCE